MNDLEYDIIDELYFVTTYKDLQFQINFSKEKMDTTIKILLEKGFLNQLKFDSKLGEYIKVVSNDYKNLEEYAYLATRVGLLAHNGIDVK